MSEFKFGGVGVYAEVVCREVDEIAKIFVHYGIPINQLTNSLVERYGGVMAGSSE